VETAWTGALPVFHPSSAIYLEILLRMMIRQRVQQRFCGEGLRIVGRTLAWDASKAGVGAFGFPKVCK
jgi:hypothetical protein